MRKKGNKLLLAFTCLALFAGCDKEAAAPDADIPLTELPAGFPVMAEPEDNRFTPERWELGKRLFYDKRLSRNNTISCASCHKQQFAFSDDVAFSPGDEAAAGTSNAPTLTNIGYHPYFTRAGGVPTLEMQILVPIQEHNEFNTSILDIADKLSADAAYRQMGQAAYGREIDPFVITRAIACFERSLISGNSRFDQYRFQNRQEALTADEISGMRLFFSGRTNCSKCHGDFNFTNYAFENNGLYLHYSDSGRMRITQLESDNGKFKVPTLRNIALTAPYMHDGSLKTLEEVIEHYSAGGKGHPNKSPLIHPLDLSEREKSELAAFLRSLSDAEFTIDKKFKNE